MPLRGFFVLLVALGSVLDVRTQVSLVLAPTVGVTSTSAAFRELGQLVLPAQAAGLSSSAGVLAGGSIGVGIPLSSWFTASPRVTVLYNSFAFTASEPTTFLVGGVPNPGTILHNYAITGSAVELGADIRVKLFEHLWLYGALDASLPIAMNGTQDQTITDPQGVLFTDGSSSFRSADSAIPGTQVAPYVSVGISFPIVYSDFDVHLEVSYRTPLSSVVDQADLLPRALVARVAFSLPFNTTYPRNSQQTSAGVLPIPDKRTATLPPRNTTDTILSLPQPPAVVASCSVLFKTRDGEVVQSGAVRMTHELAQIWEQHEGGIPLRRADTVTVADPPSVIINPVVRTDDDVSEWSASIQFSDTTVVIARGVGDVPREIEWVPAAAPQRLLQRFLRDSGIVTLRAVGRRGGIGQSTPTTVYLDWQPVPPLVDTTQFVAVLTGYELNQTSVPAWCKDAISWVRGKAGSGTHNAIVGMADGLGELNANAKIARERARLVQAALTPLRFFLQTQATPSDAVSESQRSRDRGVKIICRRPVLNR